MAALRRYNSGCSGHSMTAALRRLGYRSRRSMPPCHLEAWRSLMEEARLLPPPPHHAASRRHACIDIGHCCVPLLCALFGAAAHRIFMGSNLPQFPGPNELGTNDRTQFTAGRLYMLRIVASSCCPLFLQADPLQPPPHCQSAWPRGAAVLNCRHCCRSSALGSGVGQGAAPASR